MLKELIAEALGTLFLTAFICATVIATGRMEPQAPVALITALGAGFALSGCYCICVPVSRGHFNPAVSIAAWIARRHPASETFWYIGAQLLGTALGACMVFLIMAQQPGFQPMEFAANGYGKHSPAGLPAGAVLAAEAVFTLYFVLVFLRAERQRNAVLIGLAFAAGYLALYGISGASLNPARSTGAALFAESWAIDQLWAFWLGPILGGVGAGLLHKHLFDDDAP